MENKAILKAVRSHLDTMPHDERKEYLSELGFSFDPKVYKVGIDPSRAHMLKGGSYFSKSARKSAHSVKHVKVSLKTK